jgi:mRNA interferase MazF
MKRGEVWWISFGISTGGEVRKKRPAVIVSNDAANRHLNRLQVIPLTGSIERLYPSEAYVTFRNRQSKTMADLLTTVSKKRLINRAGILSGDDMHGIAEAMRIQLDLP